MLFGARTGATRPRQMFRDACPFIPAYYVLILGACSCKARNTRPNRSIDMHMHDSLHRAHASKNATERRLKEGSLSWLFDRLHACRANPLHARSRVFRMVSDTPVLRFLPLPCPDISIDWYSKFQRWWWWWHFWNGRIFRWYKRLLRGFEFKGCLVKRYASNRFEG